MLNSPIRLCGNDWFQVAAHCKKLSWRNRATRLPQTLRASTESLEEEHT